MSPTGWWQWGEPYGRGMRYGGHNDAMAEAGRVSHQRGPGRGGWGSWCRGEPHRSPACGWAAPCPPRPPAAGQPSGPSVRLGLGRAPREGTALDGVSSGQRSSGSRVSPRQEGAEEGGRAEPRRGAEPGHGAVRWAASSSAASRSPRAVSCCPCPGPGTAHAFKLRQRMVFN